MTFIRKAKNSAHLLLAFGANAMYAFPSRGMTIVGVTGTDGKTTTSNLLYHILKTAGKKAAVISTLGAVIDGKQYETGFHVTTPSPFAVQKYLKMAKKHGCEFVVLEVTSHALDQNRVWGIPFDVGILTNITHEHLDYHKSYERYVKTKLKLLKKTRLAVVNSNGSWFSEVKKIVTQNNLISYSLHGANKNDVTILNLPFQIKTKLLGDFNLENILAASAAAMSFHIDPEVIDKAVSSFEAPIGRQEIIKNSLGITIVVDFAHTANSFENILPALRKQTRGRLIHVFGCAGERDHKKRPEMGKAASFYDDVIILTAEDPRSESPSEINKSIRSGIEENKEVIEIIDRGEAISYALSIAEKGDTVVVTGKGHELSMNLGNGEMPWSDQEEVRKFLKK